MFTKYIIEKLRETRCQTVRILFRSSRLGRTECMLFLVVFLQFGAKSRQSEYFKNAQKLFTTYH